MECKIKKKLFPDIALEEQMSTGKNDVLSVCVCVCAMTSATNNSVWNARACKLSASK